MIIFLKNFLYGEQKPYTIIDRSILLELRRKLPEEKVDRLRHAESELFITLTQQLARFSIDYSDAVKSHRPELPDFLNDRAQDNWESLFALADIAGNDWPQLARMASLKLSGELQHSKSIGVELLADKHELMEILRTDRISSADLIVTLLLQNLAKLVSEKINIF